MNYFNFKRRNLLSGPHLTGSLLIIAGILVLVSPVFFRIETSMERVIGVGAGATVIGLLIVSSYSGTLIDFAGKRFKEYFMVGGFKFGEWNALPLILTVKVVSTSYMSTNTPNGISPTFSGKVTDFKTLIYSSSSEPVLSLVYSKRDMAVRDAKSLASDLNADLVLRIPERD